MTDVTQGILAAALTAGGPFFFFSAFGRLRLLRTMRNTPTAKARSAALGLAEFSGLAAEEVPAVAGPLSGVACVWWRFKVEEEHTRTNSRGRTETTWVTLADERSTLPFALRDATGQVRINPAGAEVDSPARFTRTEGGLWGQSPPPGPAAGRFKAGFGRRLRYTEWRIEPSRPLYALGFLRVPALDADPQQRPTLGSGRSGEPFFLATMSEAEAQRDVMLGMAGRLALGSALTGGGLYLAARLFGGSAF